MAALHVYLDSPDWPGQQNPHWVRLWSWPLRMALRGTELPALGDERKLSAWNPRSLVSLFPGAQVLFVSQEQEGLILHGQAHPSMTLASLVPL